MIQRVKEKLKLASPAIPLTPNQSEKFQKAVKIGLYKQLRQKGLLTDEQLKQLIELQNI